MPICRVNKINLHFHKSGKGPPIVFLSGVGARLDTWESIIEILKENFGDNLYKSLINFSEQQKRNLLKFLK